MSVLVACNDTAHGLAALRAGIVEATRRGLPLRVLILCPGGTVPPSLALLLDALPEPAEVRFRHEGQEPSDAILDWANDLDTALVVVGAQKRSSHQTFVMGGTTQRVLLDASAPVLVVKAEYNRPG